MAYTPRLVSIGPFHHRSEELKDMDIQKFLILKNFCNRTGKSIEELKGRIIRPELEMEIRRCYSEILSSEGFINMILLDAIFILELFRRKSEKDSGSSKPHEEDSENSKAREKDSENSKAHYQIDYILNRPCMEFSIRHDLLLLENQIPFFVLEELYGHLIYQHAEPNIEEKTDLLELSRGFFGDLYYGRKPSPSSPKPDVEVKHFTDLLHEAGLKFTTPDPDTYNLLDIKLRDNYCLETCPCFNLSWLLSCLPFLKSDCLERRVQRCLEVPPLCVDDYTEDLFRNLNALEQCLYPDETYICDYIVLLDDLMITTEADVMLLVENKIIDNNLGSSPFNNLGLEIGLPQNSHYDKLCQELNYYYDNIWNRLAVGTLTRVNFTDFFKGTATVVGTVVLVLTPEFPEAP
ncbi:hypothetical protein F2P56_010554 [Juglans regia]|uniref:Uncharacterized protein n=2 Tax=Juglans regia TaxID=51240 RepID=A0A834CYW0_JUGRE|nr:UPF0481 protein At3g47200-like [Juglans regia]KAF5470000.1 hypothetical protein F2P56_010554 [Juglans regia]